MHINIAVRLLDLDTHGNIKRETRHLCENMLGFKQTRDNKTNESLFQLTGQVPLCERQLRFTGRFTRMPTDQPREISRSRGIRRIAVYKSELI